MLPGLRRAAAYYESAAAQCRITQMAWSKKASF